MSNTSVATGRDHTNEIRRLSTLLEASQALSGVLNLKAALQSVLDLLERRHQVVGGTVFLLDPETRELHADATVGTRLAAQRARTRPGDGITERVIDTGKPVVVPRVSQEPALASAAGDRARGRELTYLAVPIAVGRRPGGTLEVVLTYKQDRDYQRSLEFYRVVASMIAQALKLRRSVEADRSRLAEENEHLRDELRDKYAFRSIIGNSASIQQVYEQVAQVARTNTTVLIRGESGTGKEMIAHAIHYNSPGAKKGRFELADGGTLFLDEIGDVSPSTQVKLLRVLQEREIERLGGTASIRINVRLIAATHRPLEALMEEGKFRADLFYRLAVFTIFAPPLRERKPDIMLLADHFLERYSREHGKSIRRVSTPAIDMLTSYHWPGNVRELENTIERAVLVCDGGVIHGHHLPPTLQTAEASDTIARQSLAESVEAFERDLLQDALKTCRGSCARAARLLGTTERIFNYKVRKYGVDVRRFKA